MEITSLSLFRKTLQTIMKLFVGILFTFVYEFYVWKKRLAATLMNNLFSQNIKGDAAHGRRKTFDESMGNSVKS